MIAYRDILKNAVNIARRSKLNFIGDVTVADNAATQSTDVTFAGSFTTVVNTPGADYELAPWEAVVIQTNGGVTYVDVPASPSDGDQVMVICHEDSTGHDIYVRDGGDVLSTLNDGGSHVTLIYVGSAWYVINVYTPPS